VIDVNAILVRLRVDWFSIPTIFVVFQQAVPDMPGTLRQVASKCLQLHSVIFQCDGHYTRKGWQFILIHDVTHNMMSAVVRELALNYAPTTLCEYERIEIDESEIK
jgi:hypothetical protein